MSTKQTLLYSLFATISIISIQQSAFAAISSSNVNITPINFNAADNYDSQKAHMGYQAIKIENNSDKAITLGLPVSLPENSLSRYGEEKVVYCGPRDTGVSNTNDLHYCAYNNDKDVCNVSQKLASHKSCYVWFKAVSNAKVSVGKKVSDKIAFSVTTQDGTIITKNLSLSYESDLYALTSYVGYDAMGCSVSKWNGTAWSNIAKENHCLPAALAYVKGNLYAGGMMQSINGTRVNNIAQWNGSYWSNVGGGISGGPAASVYTMYGMNDELYVGGWFDNAGSISARNIAKWNTSAWSPLGDGIGAPDSMTGVNNEIYTQDRSGNLIKWDGSKWTSIDKYVHVLANINNELFVSLWDLSIPTSNQKVLNRTKQGVYWVPMPGIANGKVQAIGNLRNEVYIGGKFNGIGDATSAVNIAKINYSYDDQNNIVFRTWSALGKIIEENSDNSFAGIRVFANTDNVLYAAGAFNKIDFSGKIIAANNIAMWDGSSWSALGDGLDVGIKGYIPSILIAPSLIISAISR